MIRKLLILLLGFCIGCAGSVAASSKTTVPMVSSPWIVQVKARVNGKEVIAWLDTGNSHTAISTKLVEELGLEFESISNIESVAGGVVPLETYTANLIEVGGVTLENVSAFKVDLLPSEGDIIIGMPLIKKANVCFKWRDGVVEIEG